MKCKVALNSVNDVKAFVNITFRAEKDVDIHCGKYHIDGKSIMGIFSLELDKAIEVELDDHDAEILLGELQRFIVEE
ncbi:HPr family phosphocarrier protein [Lachnospiraceae bacterium 38-14]